MTEEHSKGEHILIPILVGIVCLAIGFKFGVDVGSCKEVKPVESLISDKEYLEREE